MAGPTQTLGWLGTGKAHIRIHQEPHKNNNTKKEKELQAHLQNMWVIVAIVYTHINQAKNPMNSPGPGRLGGASSFA